jgi:hypothetical protein
LTRICSVGGRRMNWLWNTGGMILTGENRSTRRKPCRRATLSTTNSICTGLGSNLNFRCEKPATNRLSHCTAASTLPWELIYRKNYIPIISFFAEECNLKYDVVSRNSTVQSVIRKTQCVSAMKSTERVDVFRRVYVDVRRVASQSISAQNSFQTSGSGTRIRSTQTAVASCKTDVRLDIIIGHVKVVSLISCRTSVGHKISSQCIYFGFFYFKL